MRSGRGVHRRHFGPFISMEPAQHGMVEFMAARFKVHLAAVDRVRRVIIEAADRSNGLQHMGLVRCAEGTDLDRGFPS